MDSRFCFPFAYDEPVVAAFFKPEQSLPCCFILIFYSLLVVPLVVLALQLDDALPIGFEVYFAKPMIVCFVVVVLLISFVRFCKHLAERHHLASVYFAAHAVALVAACVLTLSTSYSDGIAISLFPVAHGDVEFNDTLFGGFEFLHPETGAMVLYTQNNSFVMLPMSRTNVEQPIAPMVHVVEALPERFWLPISCDGVLHTVYPIHNELVEPGKEYHSSTKVLQNLELYVAPIPFLHKRLARQTMEFLSFTSDRNSTICHDSCMSANNGYCDDSNWAMNGIPTEPKLVQLDLETMTVTLVDDDMSTQLGGGADPTKPSESNSCPYGTDCSDCGPRSIPTWLSPPWQLDHNYSTMYLKQIEDVESRNLDIHDSNNDSIAILPNRFYGKVSNLNSFQRIRELPKLTKMGRELSKQSILDVCHQLNEDRGICTTREMHEAVLSVGVRQDANDPTRELVVDLGWSIQNHERTEIIAGYPSVPGNINPFGQVSNFQGFVTVASLADTEKITSVNHVWCCERETKETNHVFVGTVTPSQVSPKKNITLEQCFQICLSQHPFDQDVCTLMRFTKLPKGESECQHTRATLALSKGGAVRRTDSDTELFILAITGHIPPLPETWNVDWELQTVLIPLFSIPFVLFCITLVTFMTKMECNAREDGDTGCCCEALVCCRAISFNEVQKSDVGILFACFVSLGITVLIVPKASGSFAWISWTLAFVPVFVVVGITSVVFVAFLVATFYGFVTDVTPFCRRPLCLSCLSSKGKEEVRYNSNDSTVTDFVHHGDQSLPGSCMFAFLGIVVVIPFAISAVWLGEHISLLSQVETSTSELDVLAKLNKHLGQRNTTLEAVYPSAISVVYPVVVGVAFGLGMVVLHWIACALFYFESFTMHKATRLESLYYASRRVEQSRTVEWFQQCFLSPSLTEADIIFMLQIVSQSPTVAQALGRDVLLDLAKQKSSLAPEVWTSTTAKTFGELLLHFDHIPWERMEKSENLESSIRAINMAIRGSEQRPFVLRVLPWLPCAGLCCHQVIAHFFWLPGYTAAAATCPDGATSVLGPPGFRLPSTCGVDLESSPQDTSVVHPVVDSVHHGDAAVIVVA